jgi:hypothetical protein
MTKTLAKIVLGGAAMLGLVAAQAQQPASPAPQQQSGAPAAPQQKKEIKDPAEYNAYVGAVQQQDPNAKISGLEAFLTQYPNSVMKEDALDLLLRTYAQTGNAAKLADTANRLLTVNPNNVQALIMMAYTEKGQQKWADAKSHAEKGLAALPNMPKPDGVSDADFIKQKTQFNQVLSSIAGFSALQLKDNDAAQKNLRAAVEGNPNSLEDVYPLALAYFAKPDDPNSMVNGLWFIARAVNLAQGAAKDQITKFGHAKYKNFHGSDDGWNDLLTQTATTPLPPAGFTVKQYIPPTPADQAADLVKTKKPSEMNFAEWELVLSAGKPEDQAAVWDAIKGKPLQLFEVGVIQSAADTLQLAASQDDIDANKADVTLTMTAAIPAKLVPKVGAKIDFEGTPVSYTPSPFMITMEKGSLLEKAPAKKPVPHKRPAGH